MFTAMISKTLKVILWGFAAIGCAGLIVAGLIASPVRRPPELTSISSTARAVDRSGMPGLDRFHARDGTELAYRRYQPTSPNGQLALLVHGSSGSSTAVHALAKGLAARGIETYAPDIRGHGASGTRGDIVYLGQLEDDLSDMVGEIRKNRPGAPLTLLGFSSGGGFALRVAGSPMQKLFERTVLLSPYLGYDAPSTRGMDAAGWASPDIPRFIGLTVLRRLGILCCESLPTIAFAVAPNTSANLASTYSYRLMRNFGPTQAYRDDFAAAGSRVAVFAGSADELMFADKYKDAVGEGVAVKLIAGVNHMGMVSDPAAISAVADHVANAGSGS
jgi:alpha-beta hydrolase superfamily lysophospholipase